MKGTVRSNNQSRKPGTAELPNFRGNATSSGRSINVPSRNGNTVAVEKPHPSVGKPVRSQVTSSPTRKSPNVGSAASPDRSNKHESAGSPARSQTPKLERHFSFEEDDVTVTSTPRPSRVSTVKEKPVKPARKNLPKVGTPGGSPPAIKRRLNVATGDGINAIFSAEGPGSPSGPVRRRPLNSNGGKVQAEGGKVGTGANSRAKSGNVALGKRGNVARGSDDVGGDVIDRPGVGDAGLVLGSVSPGRQGGAGVPHEGVVCDRLAPGGGAREGNESGSSATSPDSVKSQVLCEQEEGTLTEHDTEARTLAPQTDREAIPSSQCSGPLAPTETPRLIISDAIRTGTNFPEVKRNPPLLSEDGRSLPKLPEDDRTHPNPPEGGAEPPSELDDDVRTCAKFSDGHRKDSSAPEDDRTLPRFLGDGRSVPDESQTRDAPLGELAEQPRLLSQDSGVSLCQSLDANSGRNMLLESNGALVYLSRSDEIRCCQIPSDRFYGEFGDVSEDIGLDRLANLYGSPAPREPSPGPGGPAADPSERQGYLLNNGGRFNLLGEFGDVSEDLGAGRFPSITLSGSRDQSLDQPYGAHEGPGDPAQCPAAPVLDFPGLSADSGLDDFEEDMYVYDEDFAVEEAGANLDEELILEVLCANRVDQMTRTYNDIEAVSRLLEEKEKDLELTARIGKELLEQSQGLKVRLATLESEIRSAHEENTQLRHELQQKTQLLHALTSDEDGSPLDHASPLVSPSCGNMPPIPAHHLAGGRTSAKAGMELLKRRIAWLEDENKSLRIEASQLARDTQRVEEEEAKLVEGVTQQLASVMEESHLLSEELDRVRNEGGRQREEVDTLLCKLDASQVEIKRLRQENEELSSLVLITKENQDRLTTELADFKERYGEVMCLLTEAQENLRKVRQKELPSALAGSRYLAPPITTHHSLTSHFGDSIALELESSLNYGLSLDSGIHMPSEVSPKAPHYRKVFETVRSASRGSGSPSPSPLHHRHPSLGGSTCSQMALNSSFAQLSSTATLSSASSAQACRMSTRATGSTPQPHGTMGYTPSRASTAFGETPRHLYGALPSTGFHSLDSTGQSEESDQSEITTDSEDCLYPGTVRDGIPGSPGAKELQAALARIAKQQQTPVPQLTKGEKAIGGYEGKSRESSLDAGSHRWSLSSMSSVQHQQLPYGCRTPDSIMSTGSSRGSARSTWRMPEKLQIVKPLEGSLTLGWWSRLATPSLSAALEERPGVKVRGGAAGDGVTQHTLLDLEEDDSVSIASTKEAPLPLHPGKFFQGTGSVYTYTNSTVMHPDNTVPPRLHPRRRDLITAIEVREMRQPRCRSRKGSDSVSAVDNATNRSSVLVKSL